MYGMICETEYESLEYLFSERVEYMVKMYERRWNLMKDLILKYF